MHRNTLHHCNTLQHNATHYNMKQHTANTATHCNTLQHTATHCSTQLTATHSNTQQHTATHCNTLTIRIAGSNSRECHAEATFVFGVMSRCKYMSYESTAI